MHLECGVHVEVGTLFGCINALNVCLRLCPSGPLPIWAHVKVILVSWAEGGFRASGSMYMSCAGTLECMAHSLAGALHMPTSVLTGPQRDNSQGMLLHGNF